MDFQAWLTPSQAARELEVSSQSILKMTKQGRLVFMLTPLGRLINRESVEARKREKEEAKV